MSSYAVEVCAENRASVTLGWKPLVEWWLIGMDSGSPTVKNVLGAAPSWVSVESNEILRVLLALSRLWTVRWMPVRLGNVMIWHVSDVPGVVPE